MNFTVDDGPIIPTAPCYNYAEEKWPELVSERQRFIQREITSDCRNVSMFIREAEQMFQSCGYSSIEEMIEKGYGLDPSEMQIMVSWLELNSPRHAVPIKRILPNFKLRDKSGRPAKNDEQKNPDNIRINYGTSAKYLLALLERDYEEIFKRYGAGEFKSVRAAAIAAGIVKQKSTLERFLILWNKAAPDERAEIKKVISTGT